MKGFMHISDMSDFSTEEFYQLCFDLSQDVLFLIDRKMDIIQVSNSIENIIGYQPEDCRGISFLSLNRLNGESIERFWNDFEIILSGRRISRCEYSGQRNTGEAIELEVDGAPLFKKGRVSGAILSIRDVTPRKTYELELRQILGNLRKSLDVTIKTISRTVDYKDPYTAGHQQRVSDLARSIATVMNMDNDSISGIRMAGILHDIGKISIPSEILSKPGRLHRAEFELIKFHPKIGFDILCSIDFPWPVAATVLQHHEREDGSGYPFRITGTHILKEAKIIGVADVVEAFATHRPYRASKGIEEALDEIEKNSGNLYDPEAVEACLHLFRDRGYAFVQ